MADGRGRVYFHLEFNLYVVMDRCGLEELYIFYRGMGWKEINLEKIEVSDFFPIEDNIWYKTFKSRTWTGQNISRHKRLSIVSGNVYMNTHRN